MRDGFRAERKSLQDLTWLTFVLGQQELRVAKLATILGKPQQPDPAHGQLHEASSPDFDQRREALRDFLCSAGEPSRKDERFLAELEIVDFEALQQWLDFSEFLSLYLGFNLII